MKNSEKLIQKKYNGVHPVCGCGCGEKTVYDHSSKDFGKFKRGHKSRIVKNYFGDPKNPDRISKIISTRKQKFASGEYDHIISAIKESRKDPTFGEKISKGAKGIPKPKPEGFGIGRIQSKKTREKMSTKHLQNWKEGNIGRRHYTSKLEDKMEELLKNNSINYQKVLYAKSIRAFYDFIIPNTNILIEVDGDFFHSNPKFYPDGPLYKTQIENNLRDQEKNQWAKDNGYKLLRFWETDINNNPDQVIEVLKKELGIL